MCLRLPTSTDFHLVQSEISWQTFFFYGEYRLSVECIHRRVFPWTRIDECLVFLNGNHLCKSDISSFAFAETLYENNMKIALRKNTTTSNGKVMEFGLSNVVRCSSDVICITVYFDRDSLTLEYLGAYLRLSDYSVRCA